MVQFLDHIAKDDERSDSNIACSAGLLGYALTFWTLCCSRGWGIARDAVITNSANRPSFAMM